MTSGSDASAMNAARSSGSIHGRMSRRSVSRLNTAVLDHLKHPQKIRAEDLLHFVLVHAALEQPRGHGGKAGGGLQAARQRRDAVEVGADADMLEARDLGRVHDVIDGVVELRDRAARGGEPDPARVPVPRVVSRRVGAAAAGERGGLNQARSGSPSVESFGGSSVPPSPCAGRVRFCAAMIPRATSSFRNAEKKLIMQMPPFCASARSMSSVMLRGWRQRARHDECVATTGTRVVPRTWSKALSLMWETSTIMPRSFIVRTTSRPKFVRPPWRPASPEESHQLFVFTCVSVM